MKLTREVKESHWYLKLVSHLSTVRTLASCGEDYSLGVQSVRQVVSFQALSSLFFEDNPTNYIIKKDYLRVYFQIFISKQ